jgi:hypothetical protein
VLGFVSSDPFRKERGMDGAGAKLRKNQERRAEAVMDGSQ